MLSRCSYLITDSAVFVPATMFESRWTEPQVGRMPICQEAWKRESISHDSAANVLIPAVMIDNVDVLPPVMI